MFITTVAVLMLLYGCVYKSWQGKRPCDQPNTNWTAKDGTITFSINESGSGRGKIVIDGEIVNVRVEIGPATQIDIYPLENVHDNTVYGNYIESWYGEFDKSDKFTATVEKLPILRLAKRLHFTV